MWWSSPTLFQTCWQIWNEGLSHFYRKHSFEFYVEHGGFFLAIILWLIKMGSLNRNYIRQLHVEFKSMSISNRRFHTDRIHQLLTDQPTVVYVPMDVKTLVNRVILLLHTSHQSAYFQSLWRTSNHHIQINAWFPSSSSCWSNHLEVIKRDVDLRHPCPFSLKRPHNMDSIMESNIRNGLTMTRLR